MANTLIVHSMVFTWNPQAYLLLREREKAGVEPISKVFIFQQLQQNHNFSLQDLIDPEKLLAHLPSDEELKEAGVVINI